MPIMKSTVVLLFMCNGSDIFGMFVSACIFGLREINYKLIIN